MRKLALSTATAMALFTLPEAVEASGDYGCYFKWSLASPSFECANRAFLAPGNDTRVNMLLLLRDRAGLSTPGGRTYSEADYTSSEFGHVFLNWNRMQASYYPTTREYADDGYGGRRCDSLSGADKAFGSALLASRRLPDTDRDLLSQSRAALAVTCKTESGERSWPDGISSKLGHDFLSYVRGADAFYAGRFDEAGSTFAELKKSRDPWVSETAAYMVARNELVASQSTAFDDWGWYLGSEMTEKDAARRGQAALADYLKAYPKGLYAASARGLQRRALWLLGDREALGRAYAGILAELPADAAAIPGLIEEIDNKLLFSPGLDGRLDAPMFLATWNLQRMRGENEMYGGALEPITAEEIASQAPVFDGHPDLYAFVQASYAYYVAEDYRKVLELLPGDARRKGYTPLEFSRQMLRGMALDALKDPNASAFWLGLAEGAQDLYQRPVVELAIAMNWERGGELARVFAKGSPVGESEIRMLLLQHSAGATLLREQAQRSDRPSRERSLALFVLLTKQLQRGQYGGFLGDLKLVPQDASKDGWIGGLLDAEAGDAPVGLFANGNWSEDYACPALTQTGSALARNPGDARALLCLGDFYRLNGFDWNTDGEAGPGADELGGAANEFTGEVMTRQALYQRVVADLRAPASEKAYALYRAVWCYGPSGNNDCGGEDVPVAQRKAWFQQLKRDYPSSLWAKDLKYYW